MSDEICNLLCLDAPRAEAMRVGPPGVEAAGEAAERARMFSDPTRLLLAMALGEGGELCVCDLAWISSRAGRMARGAGVLRPLGEAGCMCYDLTAG